MKFSPDIHGPLRMNCNKFDPHVEYIYPNIQLGASQENNPNQKPIINT